MSRPNSLGSYSRSASWTTTYSRVASWKPRRSAAPLPMLKGWANTRTRGSSIERAIASVPSVEPSSTTTSSPVYGLASTRSTTTASVSASLKQGITTDRDPWPVEEDSSAMIAGS